MGRDVYQPWDADCSRLAVSRFCGTPAGVAQRRHKEGLFTSQFRVTLRKSDEDRAIKADLEGRRRRLNSPTDPQVQTVDINHGGKILQPNAISQGAEWRCSEAKGGDGLYNTQDVSCYNVSHIYPRVAADMQPYAVLHT